MAKLGALMALNLSFNPLKVRIDLDTLAGETYYLLSIRQDTSLSPISPLPPRISLLPYSQPPPCLPLSGLP